MFYLAVFFSDIGSCFVPQDGVTPLLLAIQAYHSDRQSEDKERGYVIKRLLESGAMVNGSDEVDSLTRLVA